MRSNPIICGGLELWLTVCVLVGGNSVKMENCVISNGARIGDKASLKDCELGRNVVVDPDCLSLLLSHTHTSTDTDFGDEIAQLKNEKLVEEEED